MTPADWIAAEIDAGRTQLQPMLERAPFPTAVTRTVAETGDFRIDAGHVRRTPPKPASWFPETPLIDGRLHHTLAVTDDMRAGGGVVVPMAVGNLLQIPRMGFVTLHIADGPVGARLMEDHVLLGPVKALAGATGTVELVFDPAGELVVLEGGH